MHLVGFYVLEPDNGCRTFEVLVQFMCTVITERHVSCLRNRSSSGLQLYKNNPTLVVSIQVHKRIPDGTSCIQRSEDSFCGLPVFWQAVCTHFAKTPFAVFLYSGRLFAHISKLSKAAVCQTATCIENKTFELFQIRFITSVTEWSVVLFEEPIKHLSCSKLGSLLQ